MRDPQNPRPRSDGRSGKTPPIPHPEPLLKVAANAARTPKSQAHSVLACSDPSGALDGAGAQVTDAAQEGEEQKGPIRSLNWDAR
eukprot:1969496-Pyramimonas_sp.AAC.1